MAVTYVPAAVRDTRRAVDIARQLDVRHALLAVTSILAVLAVGLSYGGRISAMAFTAAQVTTAPIDLNGIKDASALVPLLEPIVPNAIERRAAANEIYQLIASRRARGETLPNVGALLDAKVTVDGKPRPVLTREQLTALKPSVIVRSPAQVRTQIVLWGSIYLACVWAVALFWWTRAIRGDYLLLSAAHLLTALGFAVLLSRQDPLRDTLLFVRYAQGTSLGLLLFGWVSSLNLRKASLVSLSYLPLLGALLLSIVLFVFGQGPAGSNAKVNLGPVQPVEAIRLLLALFLAGYFARRWELLRDVRGENVRDFRVPTWLNVPRVDYVLPLLAGVAAALLFFFLQKDLGPALFVSCVFLATYAIARNRIGLTLVGFAILIAGFYIGYELNISSTLTARVAMWQSSWDNAVRGGDQIAQAIWGVSSGGLFGTGLGLGDTRYLPAGHTDLVLAAIGEELGFVGLLGVGAIVVMIAARGFSAALHAADDYGFFLATVVTLFLTLPVIIMAAGILGLVPLTGVVTPFLSFGGSAMVANFIALGLIVAIRNASKTPLVGHVLSASAKATADRRSSKSEGWSDVPSGITSPFRPAIHRLAGVLGVAGVALIVVLFNDQVLRADTYAVRPHLGLQGDGVRRFQYNPRVVDVLARIPRGSVYDRRGLPLATADQTVAKKANDLYRKAGLTSAGCDLPIEERCYPLGAAAFHILGDARDRRNWSASNTAYVERDLQDHLRGFDDHATSVKADDTSGHQVSTIRRDYRALIPLLRNRYSPGQSDVKTFMSRTRDVTLTIDAPFQAQVENILSKYATRSATGHAAAVVIDPDTGNLLAVASYPLPREAADDIDAARRERDRAKPGLAEAEGEGGREDDGLLDRARFGLYPPGSTFKIVTASAALREEPALSNKTFICSVQDRGRVGAKISGWGIVRDDEQDTHAHGTIDMHDGLVQSCNAYFAQLAVRVGPQSMLDTAHLLGISIARDDSLERVRATLPHAGYGQGDVVATPLRMARVAAAIASDGVLRDTTIERSSTPTRTQVWLRPDAARMLGRDLRDAVLNGTGRALRDHRWRIAGKTGTAEVSDAQSHAWFVGYAPYGSAEKRVAFAVIIENAGYGGRAAAPAAGEIVTAAAANGLVR